MKIIKEDTQVMIIKDRMTVAFIVEALFTIFGVITLFYPEIFSYNVPPWFSIVGIFAFVMIFFTKILTITLDKGYGKIVFSYKSIMTSNRSEFDLDQIKEIEATPYYTNVGNSHGIAYVISFVTLDNQKIIINEHERTIKKSWGKPINPYKDMCNRIAAFLQIPFIEKEDKTQKYDVLELLEVAYTQAKQNALLNK